MGLQQQGLRNGSRYHQLQGLIKVLEVDSKGRPRSREVFLFFVKGDAGTVAGMTAKNVTPDTSQIWILLDPSG